MQMKVLVIGNGGREHALVWKIAQSEQVSKIFCAPGNPGTELIAENISISSMDFENLIRFAKNNHIYLTVVGPEDPLVSGIVNLFEQEGLKIFGPDENAAQLEGSKTFAKNLMQKYDIPTAAYQSFTSAKDAKSYITEKAIFPLVLKASGLAAGKGVLICPSENEALEGIKLIMDTRAFGAAGDSMIVEDFLEGEEVSIFAMTDGRDYLLLSPAQDHKKVFDDDRGKNTGGMGAYAPAPIATTALIEQVKSSIIGPTLKAMQSEGKPYKGLLYIGVIITKDGPKVLEYNCRFGDPETEIILPLLKSDLVPLMLATIEGNIKDHTIHLHDGFALDVVLASGGYPDHYEKGKIIMGLNALDPDIFVFHAGTKSTGKQLLTNGGRVLNIVAKGNDFLDLRGFLYKNIKNISFDGMQYRKDIGFRALKYM
jgi:phosphoribosylamine--glycine ligase